MKKTLFLFLISIITLAGYSQIPTGYYNGTENLTGTALKAELHNIIDNHNSVSYSSLWTHFQNTDKKSDNTVWDMYSDVPGGTPPYTFTFITDQCGNYGQESDCYNREHSWPQSWFNSSSPMSTDIFHLYPTDGYVNGQRSNYPFGETDNATWTSQNGSKKGPCSYPGNSGTIFEPIDEYKGDFARTYFYMSARYYNEDSGWLNNEMVDGAELKQWAKNMLIEWHTDDPVSTKEINRNNAVYAIQNNRNPFIDHPEFAGLIFGQDYPQPILDGVPLDTITENNYYEFIISGADDFGNDITFYYDVIPGWLNFIDQSNNTAILSGTPGNGDIGNHEISIWGTNNYSEPVELNFFIEVVSLNEIIDNNSTTNRIIIYPNPADDILFVNSNLEICKQYIYSVEGKEITQYKTAFQKNILAFNLKNLETGFYILKLVDIRNNSTTFKFIKE